MSISKIRVCLFCGGRGSSSLIRELIRVPNVELSLLINAYDDGLSTGELRGFIPGMLGPSDFRKNLSYLVLLYSNQQLALTQLLEYRLPQHFNQNDLVDLKKWALSKNAKNVLPPTYLEPFLQPITEDFQKQIKTYLSSFFNYADQNDKYFNYADCSFGNLLFAGAYLQNDNNFNAATAELARFFSASATLINVTKGENRILVGLKEDGSILECEAKIVGKQSASPIKELFLLSKPMSKSELLEAEKLKTIQEKITFLKKLEEPVYISKEAKSALEKADIIIYGPGTQYSSLFPSYKTVGIKDALLKSKALCKVFVCNIHRDHDIQSLTVEDLLDQALYFLDDTENNHRLITHVLTTHQSSDPDKLLKVKKLNGDLPIRYKNILWIDEALENPHKPGTHSGIVTVKSILSLERSLREPTANQLDIYVDLKKSSVAIESLLQEFLDLPWQTKFSKVKLIFNQYMPTIKSLPSYLEVEKVHFKDDFSEVKILSHWAKRESSQLLATLTGDGEYRLSDLFFAADLLKNQNQNFAMIIGSRNQSRHQLMNSIHEAYGESKSLSTMSWLGAFAFSSLFALKFKVVLSDPFSGFRIYNRLALIPILNKLSSEIYDSASEITKLIVENNLDIAEIPVSYRAFKGFTNVNWRLRRGLMNVKGIFG